MNEEKRVTYVVQKPRMAIHVHIQFCVLVNILVCSYTCNTCNMLLMFMFTFFHPNSIHIA